MRAQARVIARPKIVHIASEDFFFLACMSTRPTKRLPERNNVMITMYGGLMIGQYL